MKIRKETETTDTGLTAEEMEEERFYKPAGYSNPKSCYTRQGQFILLFSETYKLPKIGKVTEYMDQSRFIPAPKIKEIIITTKEK